MNWDAGLQLGTVWKPSLRLISSWWALIECFRLGSIFGDWFVSLYMSLLKSVCVLTFCVWLWFVALMMLADFSYEILAIFRSYKFSLTWCVTCECFLECWSLFLQGKSVFDSLQGILSLKSSVWQPPVPCPWTLLLLWVPQTLKVCSVKAQTWVIVNKAWLGYKAL